MTDYFETIAPSLTEARDSLSKINHKFSLLRLFSFVAALAFAIAGFVNSNNIILYIVSAFMLIVFIILCAVHKYSMYNEKLMNEKILANGRYLSRIKGDFTDLTDDGEQFKDPSHQFASDLDVFGPHSVFALYNTSHSVFGRKAFADRLKCKHFDVLSKSFVANLQKIVKSLSDDPEFLLNYEAVGALHPIDKVPNALIVLCAKDTKLTSGKKLLWKIMPFIWLIPVVMSFVGAGKYIRLAVLSIILINLLTWFFVSKMDLSDIFKSGLISKQAESIKKRVEILLDDDKRITIFVPDYIDSKFPDDLDALI